MLTLKLKIPPLPALLKGGSGEINLFLMVSERILICHPELVSGSRKSLILLDAEPSSA